MQSRSPERRQTNAGAESTAGSTRCCVLSPRQLDREGERQHRRQNTSAANAAVGAPPPTMTSTRGPKNQRHSDDTAELREALRSSGFVEIDSRGRDKQGISRGSIPLIYAAERGNSPIVRALIDQGDSVSITDDAGYTALHVAAQNGHLAVTRMLARGGSNLDAVSHGGDTPLHMAANTGHSEVIGALVEEGAFVDSRNPGGATPLYVAAMEGHVGAVRKLLDARVNPSLTWSNSSGKTFVPLDVAVQTGRLAIVRKLLRRFGIDRWLWRVECWVGCSPPGRKAREGRHDCDGDGRRSGRYSGRRPSQRCR